MSRDHDHLVYDGELGWIDPEDPLGSIGIRIDMTDEYILFQNASISDFGPLKNQKFWFPRDRERLAVIRRCLEYAEWQVEQREP